jgi:hypothetical protein
MICRYDDDEQYVSVCDSGTQLTGKMFSNTIAYNIYSIPTPITGINAFSGYFNHCDSINTTYERAKNSALSQRRANPCSYRVSTIASGDCPDGSAQLYSLAEGIGEDVDVYQAYLEAYAEASGLLATGCQGGSSPIITSHPVSITVLAGEPASFSVTAIGSPILVYQWQKNGIDIAGGVSPTLNLTNVQNSNVGAYACQVSNGVGSVLSNTAFLIVTARVPVFILNLSATTTYNLVGSSVTLTIAAKGTEPLTYEWFKDGISIGNNNPSLTIANGQITDSGNYVCIVSNSIGSATSNIAPTNFGTVPVITINPISQTVNSGSPVSFTVTATGSATLTYQWYKNGIAIGGETASTLSIGSASHINGGLYSCIISNNYGSVQSSSATLTVNAPLTITVQPTNVNGTYQTSQNFTITVTGTMPVTFTWYKVNSPLNITKLVETKSSSPATSTYTFTLSGSTEGSYFCVASNGVTTVTSNTVTAIGGDIPEITTQPYTESYVDTGTSITIFIQQLRGTSFQWKKNGVNIGGATNQTLTISNFSSSDYGIYTCVVTNAFGSVTSHNCELKWNFLTICSGGTPFATSNNGDALKAFDDNNSTYWVSYDTDKAVGYQFSVSKIIKWFQLSYALGDGLPGTHTLSFQGGDGSTWTTLDTWAQTNPVYVAVRYVNLSNSTLYTHYRVLCNSIASTAGSQRFQVLELKMNNT